MSAPPDDPTLEQVANQPEVQVAVQQLRGNGVAVSAFQDFAAEYGGPDPTPNMETAKDAPTLEQLPKQPEIQEAGQKLAENGFETSPFQDFAAEYSGPPNMENAKEQAKQMPPPKDVSFDPEPDR